MMESGRDGIVCGFDARLGLELGKTHMCFGESCGAVYGPMGVRWSEPDGKRLQGSMESDREMKDSGCGGMGLCWSRCGRTIGSVA